MVLLNNKKGQAAIEFLMTYGWMLLVVLIVGALIFSFVDFGSLLPNKVGLSNNLKGSPTDSLTYSKDYPGTTKSVVKVVFRYIGVKRVSIAAGAGLINTNLGKQCISYNISNLDTSDTSGCGDGSGVTNCVSTALARSVTFLNGQSGIITFACDSASSPKNSTGPIVTSGTPLLKNDILDGSILIKVKNPKTGLEVPSAGKIRLSISQ